MTRRRGVPAVALTLLAGCAGSPTAVDLDGHPQTPLAVADGSVHVLVFTSHECPIANAYAPVLRELAEGWRHHPVRLFLVHVDPDLTATAAREHARSYELPGTVLLDPPQQLASHLGVTRTPEAVVLRPGHVAYRGRIDDRWHALGKSQPTATRHDLQDAVALALTGRDVPLPHPWAVGCLLPEPRR